MWLLRRKQHSQWPSKVALHEAQTHLERIKRRTPEVEQVTTAQRNLIERNHFVERLQVIMGGNR